MPFLDTITKVTTARRASVPACWTDRGPQDPFVEQARGRAIARVEDLLELANLVSGTMDRGLLTARQIEDMLGPGTNRAKYWRKMGVLKVVKLNQHYKDLYQRPTEAELEMMRHRHRNPSTPNTK